MLILMLMCFGSSDGNRTCIKRFSVFAGPFLILNDKAMSQRGLQSNPAVQEASNGLPENSSASYYEREIV